jgi:toxin ParE1/3/4
MPQYELARTARADIVDLLAHTEANFGEIARLRYERLVATALQDIAAEPDRIGSVARPALGQGVRSYHLRHSQERARTEHGIVLRPRHLLLYRHLRTNLIGIGRVLHDAMEIGQHVPREFGDERP